MREPSKYTKYPDHGVAWEDCTQNYYHVDIINGHPIIVDNRTGEKIYDSEMPVWKE